MGFSGRCEAIKAPTTENDTVQMAKLTIPCSEIKNISPRVCSLRRARIKFAAASATHSAHSDQASHAETRALILPSPRPRSLAPSVTTSLYSITGPQALRNALRGSLYEARRERTSEKTPSGHLVNKTSAGASDLVGSPHGIMGTVRKKGKEPHTCVSSAAARSI